MDGWRMNLDMNGKLFEKVKCLKCLGSHVAGDERIDREVKFKINDVGKDMWSNEENV